MDMDRFTSVCTFVQDGDTIGLSKNALGKKWVRLISIDAPEIQQRFGMESKRNLELLVKGRKIEVVPVTIDKYNRLVAQIMVNGIDLSESQVLMGMAYPYFLHNLNKEAILKATSYAKENRIGVWSIDGLLPPAKFRAMQKQPFLIPKPLIQGSSRGIFVGRRM